MVHPLYNLGCKRELPLIGCDRGHQEDIFFEKESEATKNYRGETCIQVQAG